MNLCMFIGNLGKDPETRTTQTGKEVTTFSIGVNEYYTAANGEQQQLTTWVRCVAWGTWARVAATLKKGSFVEVKGKLRVRTYQKDGKTQYATEINVNDIASPIRLRREDNAYYNGSQQNTQGNNRGNFGQFGPSHPEPSQQGAPYPEEDIPF